MPINDYRCVECNEFIRDSWGTPDECPNCKGINCFEIDFRGWQKLALVNDGQSITDRLDRNNAIQNAHCADDPLCMMEMGLHPDGHNVAKLTREESTYFREKWLKDGDSGKLRKELLAARDKAVKKVDKEGYSINDVYN